VRQLRCTPVTLMHGGVMSRLKDLHPSTVRRPSHLKTGHGACATSCLSIPQASCGASARIFPVPEKRRDPARTVSDCRAGLDQLRRVGLGQTWACRPSNDGSWPVTGPYQESMRIRSSSSPILLPQNLESNVGVGITTEISLARIHVIGPRPILRLSGTLPL
jgi:hypothetical protein